MRSRWSSEAAAGLDALALRVYTSRLLGAEPSLVLYGGGNTSVKHTAPHPRGGSRRTLTIKGSGTDLATIQAGGFASLALDDLVPLRKRATLDDDAMVELVTLALLDSRAPRPSIETLLHAFIPLAWVDHSHADAILTLTNQPDGVARVRDVFADSVGLVPYIKPGFDLSRVAADVYDSDPAVEGLILDKHGLVTFGETAQESYERHIQLVSRAEARISQTWVGPRRSLGGTDSEASRLAVTLRGALSRRRHLIVRCDTSLRVRAFVDRRDLDQISQQGPATPDHVLRTKRLPLVLPSADPDDAPTAVARYEAAYHEYVEGYADAATDFRHDPGPRVVLAPGVGMFTTGRTAAEADAVARIYRHTMDVIEGAESIDAYAALPARDLFDIEYWPLELYKLKLAPPDRELAGRVALVTGAASGIGRATSRRLAAAGAHVFVTDIDTAGADSVATQIRGAGDAAEPMKLDVTDKPAVELALHSVVLAVGGVDIVVSNAGIADAGSIDALGLDAWQQSLDVNATGHFLVTQAAVRAMREQGIGGSLVLVCTKNALDPGRDFGAYSAAKAAQLQLGRVLAIENGEHGIRVNMVNPDAVFADSRLWSDDLRAGRAAAHGVTVDELEDFYRRRNLLQTRIDAGDVAEAVLFLASDRAAKTTGAVLPVDGGVRGAFPR
ncbi:MAG: bifunctional rhamnulose-1-phosphate aldolase/short-chain dehydrogenase [Chloroflexota bacterium]|nr:bifunctional rhamnulose-1-phosphate aldolase/short-chain dehydrogenase [Chloroflexota bacterium]